MTADEREELFDLLSALCDSNLAADERDRLERLLEDPACRRAYLMYMTIHARLPAHPHLTSEPSLPPDAYAEPEPPHGNERADRPKRRSGRQVWYAAAVAAVALIASLLVWRADRRPPGVPADDRAAEYVASLAYTGGCVWESAPGLTTAGARLLPGDLAIRQGVALLRFDDGAELILEGPLDLRIESASAATLRSGKVVFRTDGLAGPFVLKTPDSVLRDQGTEYAVRVGPVGEEVHVFDGTVLRTAQNDTTATEVLPAGEARRFSGAAGPGSPIDAAPNEFVRLSDLPADRPAGGADELLAYEGFDYAVPELPAVGGGDGGTGWAGPWAMGGPPFRVDQPGLTFRTPWCDRSAGRCGGSGGRH